MKFSWEARLALALIAASVIIYTIKLQVLHNLEVTVNYIFNSLGFLPINVLIVTLIINQLLAMRSKREKLEKLNMVIGTFFSEVGTHLLAFISDHDPDLEKLRSHLVVQGDWDDEDFRKAESRLRELDYSVDMKKEELEYLHSYLSDHRDFLLRLLENPVLLEHESFTDLLRAVFHLTEELGRREDLSSIPDSDVTHLSGDVERSYRFLAQQWLDYANYLRKRYPYLFSLAMRTNPFDATASAVVR
ncbi:MAG: hypothetical protein RQ758_02040 [Methanomicrobiaceae archaeon]|nr:hypothetical protein [Methanomicrobiaceae archaeon]